MAPTNFLQGYRLIGAAALGNVTGPQLESLLANPARRASFDLNMQDAVQQQRLIDSSIALQTFALSLDSYGALPDRVREAVRNDLQAVQNLLATVLGEDPSEFDFDDIADFVDDPAVMSIVFGSEEATDVIAASALAMAAIADSQSAMAQAMASQMVMTKFAASQIAMEELALKETAVDALLAADEMTLLAFLGGDEIDSFTGGYASSKFWGGLRSDLGGYIGISESIAGDRWLVIQSPQSVEIAPIKWKNTNDDSPNTGDDYFGLANANAQNNANHPLFQAARNMTHGGFSDWAPPAKIICEKLVAKYRQGVATNPLFQAGGAQAYAEELYWTATQHPSGTSTAWRVDFSNGSAYTSNKHGTYRCRAVRMLKL